MVKAADLCRLWQRAYDERWGYIWGETGQIWTAAKQVRATRETTIKYGSQWIGKRVSDCSGLAYWAFKSLGQQMYHGSNTIWNKYVTGRCKLKNGQREDGQEMLVGDPVFLLKDGIRHHIGYYMGGDTVIEAKGTQVGVVQSKLTRWHETAHWLNVEYEGGVVFVGYPVLKKGSSGEFVTKLQKLLNGYGYKLDVDGKFGAKTEQAVKAFQQGHFLDPDGIVGDKTWAALNAQETPSEPGETENMFVMPLESAKELYKHLRAALDILNQADWSD